MCTDNISFYFCYMRSLPQNSSPWIWSLVTRRFPRNLWRQTTPQNRCKTFILSRYQRLDRLSESFDAGLVVAAIGRSNLKLYRYFHTSKSTEARPRSKGRTSAGTILACVCLVQVRSMLKVPQTPSGIAVGSELRNRPWPPFMKVNCHFDICILSFACVRSVFSYSDIDSTNSADEL